MFSTAKKLDTKVSAGKKAEKLEVALEGLESFAAVKALIASLSAVAETMEADLKLKMADHFIESGCAAKKRPESFKGVEGVAHASCELRIRSTTSKLTPEDAARLTAAGISVATEVKQIGTYVINPAYKDDAALLGKVEKALKGVKGVPEDLFMVQEEVSHTVCAKTAIDELFAKHKHVDARELLPLISVPAIKPVFGGDDTAAFEIVNAVLNPAEEPAAAEEPAPVAEPVKAARRPRAKAA